MQRQMQMSLGQVVEHFYPNLDDGCAEELSTIVELSRLCNSVFLHPMRDNANASPPDITHKQPALVCTGLFYVSLLSHTDHSGLVSRQI